jgi:flavin reductase (DIM6/NTAB) family NADH-FMN oxidoreductase RutF
MLSSKSSAMTTPPITSAEFRQALGQFATGVTVVTVERDPGLVHGMTASSFTSVSLDPLLILVCIDQNARMLTLLRDKKRFGVSVLRENQQAVSEFFAQPDQPERSEASLGIRFGWAKDGIPILEDTLARLACTVVSSHVSGDHTIFIGKVESVEVDEGEPLLHFRGKYRKICDGE